MIPAAPTPKTMTAPWSGGPVAFTTVQRLVRRPRPVLRSLVRRSTGSSARTRREAATRARGISRRTSSTGRWEYRLSSRAKIRRLCLALR